MDVGTWGTCPRVRTPDGSLETVAHTLPTRQECLVSDVPSGAVAQLRGCAWMRGCADDEYSSGGIEYAEDWGYIRPATDGESPVYVQPVTGSLLFGYPLRSVLDWPQPNLRSPGLLWTVLADFWFSCRLVWWKTMSSGVDLPVVAQAGASPAATDSLPGTFLGLALDLRSA